MTMTGPQSAPSDASVRRGLWAILASTGISSVGDGAFVAAAPLAAAALTRDPTAVAMVAAAETLPWVLVTPFAGVFVDRWSRRLTMIVSDGLRAVAVAILAILVIRGSASVATIAVCAFAIVTGMVFHSAAAEAVIADLTQRDEGVLNEVNGRLQSLTTAGRQLLGPPAGSWSWSIAAWLPFVADAISFALSALLLWFVPKRETTPRHRNGIWLSMREGAVFLIRHQELRLLAVLTGAANLSINAGLATLVLYATDIDGLGIGVAGYGLLLAGMAIGGFVGGLTAARLLKVTGTRKVFVFGLLTEAVAWTVILTSRHAVIAGCALACIGFTVALKSVIIMSSRQRLVPSELLGRVISAYRIVGNGMAPIGAILGGLIASAWGLRASMGFAAAVLVLTAVLAAKAFRRSA